MIKLAKSYEEKIKIKYAEMFFDERFKFYFTSSWMEELKIEKNTWDTMQLVSINQFGELIGYIQYSIARDTRNIDSLAIVNFLSMDMDSDKRTKVEAKMTFGKDVLETIKDIFEKHNYNKLSYEVIKGNPIEKTYDRLTKKHNGRIVGIQKKHVRLTNGLMYDKKLYEITKEEYFEGKKANEKNRNQKKNTVEIKEDDWNQKKNTIEIEEAN